MVSILALIGKAFCQLSGELPVHALVALAQVTGRSVRVRVDARIFSPVEGVRRCAEARTIPICSGGDLGGRFGFLSMTKQGSRPKHRLIIGHGLIFPSGISWAWKRILPQARILIRLPAGG